MPGASDGDEAEYDEEKRSRQTAAKSPPAMVKSPTALTKAKKHPRPWLRRSLDIRRNGTIVPTTPEDAKKELADAKRQWRQDSLKAGTNLISNEDSQSCQSPSAPQR